MIEHKISAISYLISSIAFGVIAVINFGDGDDNTSGFVYIALCMSFFCISLSYFEKLKNKKK